MQDFNQALLEFILNSSTLQPAFVLHDILNLVVSKFISGLLDHSLGEIKLRIP